MLLNALTGRVKEHNWPVGPLLAQSAHAATAVLHRFRDHPDVERYLKGEDGRGWEGMRKVVLEVCRPFSLFFFWHSDLSGPKLCICLVERRKGRSVVDEHVLV